MEIGKKYILVGASAFSRTCTANRRMTDLIDEKGPWFEVVDMQTKGGNRRRYVTAVKFKDGKVYTDRMNGPDYFEIFEDEFYHFREFIQEPEVAEGFTCDETEIGGVVSMTIEVNQKNFEVMIDLIKKNFAK